MAEHQAARIPGARFWDIDGVCDPATDLPHMLPSAAAFAAAADALGVGNDDTLVLYDGMGLFSSPRAWWTWKVRRSGQGAGGGRRAGQQRQAPARQPRRAAAPPPA